MSVFSWKESSFCSSLTCQSRRGKRGRIHSFAGSCRRKVSGTKSELFSTECILPKAPFEFTETPPQNVTRVLSDRVPPIKGRLSPILKSLDPTMVCLSSFLAHSKPGIHVKRNTGKNERPVVQSHSEPISSPGTKGRKETAAFLCLGQGAHACKHP